MLFLIHLFLSCVLLLNIYNTFIYNLYILYQYYTFMYIYILLPSFYITLEFMFSDRYSF